MIPLYSLISESTDQILKCFIFFNLQFIPDGNSILGILPPPRGRIDLSLKFFLLIKRLARNLVSFSISIRAIFSRRHRNYYKMLPVW